MFLLHLGVYICTLPIITLSFEFRNLLLMSHFISHLNGFSIKSFPILFFAHHCSRQGFHLRNRNNLFFTEGSCYFFLTFVAFFLVMFSLNHTQNPQKLAQHYQLDVANVYFYSHLHHHCHWREDFHLRHRL